MDKLIKIVLSRANVIVLTLSAKCKNMTRNKIEEKSFERFVLSRFCKTTKFEKGLYKYTQ